MPYVPHTQKDTEEMLTAIGVAKIEDLFNAVPAQLMKNELYNLPSSLSEQETHEKISDIAKRNSNAEISFLGGGCYSHYIPAHVMHLAGRSEFYTAYTPYQPEMSQGILQSIFEYQSMITRLTAMDATNASMYDGSTASAEVCLMAADITGRKKVLVSRSVHPHYREVMKTYCDAKGIELVELPFNAESGKVDKDELAKLLTEEIAGVFVQSPNFFGVVEDMKELSSLAHAKEAVSVQIITEALSLGILTPPGEMDVDIAVGDGQSFGLSISGGGPSFGFLATTEKHMRKLPGRIVGETQDLDGEKAYVLTLQAREQHIRREKASSNICSNQAWCALIGTIYLSTLGQKLKDLALLNHQNSLHFQKELGAHGMKRTFSSPFFNEFVMDVSNPDIMLERLRKKGIDGGLDLGRFYPELKGKILVCVTEMITSGSMSKYIQSL
jgi:glycine dehydrogenase subunit 1